MVTSVLGHQAGQAGHYEGGGDGVEAEADVELAEALTASNNDEAGHDEQEASHGGLLLLAEWDPAHHSALEHRHHHPDKQEHSALERSVIPVQI